MIRRKKKGFTIVELVIVIAVIGVLAAVLIPTFISLTKKADQAADSSLRENLNTALRVKEAEQGRKNKYFHEAIVDLEEYGYKLPSLVTRTDEKLVWDQVNDEFFITNGEGTYQDVRYWEIRSNVPDSDNKRSVYAGENWTGGETISGIGYGFDVGYHSDIKEISYVNLGSAKSVDVIFHTNGTDEKLTIDAPNDTIQHYGLVGEVSITKTADGSYHERDTAGFIQVASGRVIAENAGYIDTVVLSEKGSGATLPAVIQIRDGGTIVNKYATSQAVAAANNAATDAYQLVINEDPTTGKLITASEIDDVKAEAIDEVTPDPYKQIVEDGLAIGAYFAVLREDKTLYGYELPSVLSDQHYTILMIQDYKTSNFFAVVNNSTITLDLNGTNFEITNNEGIGIFGESNLSLDVIDNKGTGSITLKSICLLGSTNTLTFNNVNFIFNNTGDGIIAQEGKMYFDGGNYTFNNASSWDDLRGMLGISTNSLIIKECKINLDPSNYVDSSNYNIENEGGVYVVTKK